MAYDLMLLGDPGTERAAVLRILEEDPRIRRDETLETRYWFDTGHGPAQLNIGSKDPVESVHVEVEPGDLARMEAASRKALELADRLEMRLEDMLWGREVTEADLPALRVFWQSLSRPRDRAPEPPPKARPWWRPW